LALTRQNWTEVLSKDFLVVILNDAELSNAAFVCIFDKQTYVPGIHTPSRTDHMLPWVWLNDLNLVSAFLCKRTSLLGLVLNGNLTCFRPVSIWVTDSWKLSSASCSSLVHVGWLCEYSSIQNWLSVWWSASACWVRWNWRISLEPPELKWPPIIHPFPA